MKTAERTFCFQIFSWSNNIASNVYQESLMSPEADLEGAIIGQASSKFLASLLSYGEGKSQKIKDYSIPLQVIGSLGLALTAATLMGKTWKDWTGDWALALSGSLMLGMNVRINQNNPNRQFLVGMAIVSVYLIGKAVLQKSRNASLKTTPYLIHGFAMLLFNRIYHKFAYKEVSHDAEKQWICSAIINTAMALLVAKAIEWKVGDKAFKFNYKAQILSGAGTLGAYVLFMSKYSPIYER